MIKKFQHHKNLW